MMIATECPPADRLRALAHGRLSDEQSDLLFDHVRGCDACRSELETLHDDGDSLIVTLRGGDGAAGLDDKEGFDEEPGCRVAVAKALGALARSADDTTGPISEALPRVIGEYEVERPLGRGGMGSVYLARHTKLGRSVAIKVLAGHRLADARMRERFDAEMQAIGRLSHPNVVSAFDAREVDGTAVLVTEYIDGFDLGELVARVGPLSVADGCEIGRRVAEALAYTSGEGFVHRDVKPSNVMLGRDGGVKLLDLGLARFQIDDVDSADSDAEPDGRGDAMSGGASGGAAGGGMTGTGQTMGTADYIAPEQVTDSRRVDVRADLYALGCTLFKLLTGRAPFADEKHGTSFAKMTAHVSEAPPSLGERLSGAPAGLVRLVDSMLAKDPSRRPSSPDVVAKALTPLAVGSDLGELVAQAERAERDAGFEASERRPQGSRQAVWWRRRVPVWGLVAAGLIGIVIGFACGITITIRTPDGSKMTMTVPDGSDVEIASTGDDDGASGRAASSGDAATTARQTVRQHSERLQGVWRLVSDQGGGATRAGDETLFIFDGSRLLFDEGNRTQIGIFSLLPDDRDSVSRIRFANPRARLDLVGFARFADDDNVFLEFTGIQSRQQADGRLPRELVPKLLELERIGAVPRTEAEFDRLPKGRAEAIREVLRIGRESTAVDDWGNADGLGPPSITVDTVGENRTWAKEAAMESRTRTHLKQIGLAFHNFHSAYRKIPASAGRKEGSTGVPSGKETYPFSWRVALLPFLEQQELFEQYRFDEPWDSEHNLTLVPKMPEVYRSPFGDTLPGDGEDGGGESESGQTHYMGFAGELSALGRSVGNPFSAFRDGTSNTLLVVESQASVPWTKPEDLPYETAEDAKRAKPFPGQPLRYLGADGAVHSMDPVDWEELAKWITRDGREVVER